MILHRDPESNMTAMQALRDYFARVQDAMVTAALIKSLEGKK